MRFDQFIGSKALKQQSVLHLKNLAIIKDECLNLVIWKRPIDPDVDLYISYLIAEGLKPINETITYANIEKVVTDHLDAFGFPAAGKIKLINDIIEITHQFFEITSASKLRLILKIVTDDACRKFHTDAYDLRLLCTYKGKATEWVEESNAKRSLLKTGENESIIKDLSKIKCMNPFEVAVLKGEPASRPQGGIIHRSPPIEGAGEKRFLFRLDF